MGASSRLLTWQMAVSLDRFCVGKAGGLAWVLTTPVKSSIEIPKMLAAFRWMVSLMACLFQSFGFRCAGVG
jgi:hypothetical protein